MQQKRKQVYLLKSRSNEGDDPYDKVRVSLRAYVVNLHLSTSFKECNGRGYPCAFVQVLSFQFCNVENLSQALLVPLEGSPNSLVYDGVIITSQRALQAVKSYRASKSDEERWKGFWRGRDVMFYVVGETTAKLTLEVFGVPRERLIVGISASALGPRVADRERERGRENREGRRLLYLCGNIRRDELPNHLKQEGIPFDELCVYKTHKMEGEVLFPWEQHDSTQHEDSDGVSVSAREEVLRYDWICFFSPSGVKVVYKNMKRRKEGGGGSSSLFPADGRMKLAAIGKTTAAAMEKKAMNADVIAEKPNSASLIGAIAVYEKEITT